MISCAAGQAHTLAWLREQPRATATPSAGRWNTYGPNQQPPTALLDAVTRRATARGLKLADGPTVFHGWNLIAVEYQIATPAAWMGVVLGTHRNHRPHFYTGTVDDAGRAWVPFLTTGNARQPGRDLDALADVAWKEWEQHVAVLPDLQARMQQTLPDAAEVNQLLVAAGRARLLPWSRVGQADHAYARGKDYSAWGLLMAFAAAVKKNAPVVQLHQLHEFNALVNQNCT